ncbi:MAG: ABC transporter permease [Dehalococcoidia bacterium]
MVAPAADLFTEAALARAARPLPLRIAFSVLNFARVKPLGFLGAIMVGFLLTMAIFAPLIAPYDPGRIDLRNALQGSSSMYKLGTNDIGQDVLSRLIWGARLSMVVGFGAVVSSSIVATVLGLVSAYFGGWVDMLIMRFIDAWIAMPDLIILITILGIVRRTEANMMYALLFALAFSRIAGVTRLYRSYVIEQRSRPFVEAAEGLGASPLRGMFRHVLPNILPMLIVGATIALPGTILAEASLSFLGFGPEGQPSWGQMLSVDGREYFNKQFGLALYPGLCIGAAVFGFMVFGDALRDILDPRLRGAGR